jgi:hypothetical protein
MSALKHHTSVQAESGRPVMTALGIAAITGLLVLLYFVRRRAARRRERKTVDEFNQSADRYGLTTVERRLAATIARLAELGEANLIFSTQDAFYRGATRLMQERFTAGDSIEDRRHLKEAIELLHRKLGFHTSTDQRAAALGLTTRQIPVGKQVFVIRSGEAGQQTARATVLANNSDGLVLTLSEQAGETVSAGEKWRVRYDFGASAWEFESTVTDLGSNTVILAHCELVRFTNRRRFLRTPIAAKAMIAPFAFQERDIPLEKAAPKFTPARVAEIAGPGIRVSTSLEAAVGQRVLVIIAFENGELVRHIADVRHAEPVPDGFSLALEFAAVSDNEISALVRLTNIAARKAEAPQNGSEVPAGKA